MTVDSSDYAVGNIRVVPASGAEMKNIRTVTTSTTTSCGGGGSGGGGGGAGGSSSGGGSGGNSFTARLANGGGSNNKQNRTSSSYTSNYTKSRNYGGTTTTNIGSNGLSSNLGCGLNINSGLTSGLGSGISNEYNIKFSGSRDRLRNFSDVSQKQHEEAATIVTKVIREDTSEMENKIRELSVVTGELQQTLKTLIEHSNGENMFVKEKMESFISVTKDMKEAIHGISNQMGEMREDIQNIARGLQSCDSRLNDIDIVIDNKLVIFRQELGDRDAAIDQIKADLERRQIELHEHSKQLSELEEHKHALYHAEETIRNRESQISELEGNINGLLQKYKQMEIDTTTKTETVTSLEIQLQQEKQARSDTSDDMKRLHQTLASLEAALDGERQKKRDHEKDLDNMRETIRSLEETLECERRTQCTNANDLAHIQNAMKQLELKLVEEQRLKCDSERELGNLQIIIDTLTKEKQELLEEGHCIRNQSKCEVDSLTQMLDKLSRERNEIESISCRERKRSEQLQESMTSLRKALEEEQQKAEENDRKLQSFDRIIKETKEMYAMKESEFDLLREEIIHYKNLVATKEKELCNLTTVFNENMAENKHEVATLRQEIKEYKTTLREKEYKLRDYRDREFLQQTVANTSSAGSISPGLYNQNSTTNNNNNMVYTHTLHSTSTGGGRLTPCRSPSPTLGYCQTHKSIVSLDSRASVGTCGASCTGHGIISVKYAEPCTKIYPTKDRNLGVTNIYQSSKGNRPIRIVDEPQPANNC